MKSGRRMVVKGDTFFLGITPACVTPQGVGFRGGGDSSDRGGETEASRRGQGCLRGSPRGGGIKGDPWAPVPRGPGWEQRWLVGRGPGHGCSGPWGGEEAGKAGSRGQREPSPSCLQASARIVPAALTTAPCPAYSAHPPTVPAHVPNTVRVGESVCSTHQGRTPQTRQLNSRPLHSPSSGGRKAKITWAGLVSSGPLSLDRPLPASSPGLSPAAPQCLCILISSYKGISPMGSHPHPQGLNYLLTSLSL